MEIPSLRMVEKRLILTIGEYQDEDDPKNMQELCEKTDKSLTALQKGKTMIDRGFVEKIREYPDSYLYLTEDGWELYELLKEYHEVLSE